MSVASKTEIDLLDGTPSKRLFWSIISDYDLRTGICELVDNSLDLWKLSGEKFSLNVMITIDVGRQLISVSDNAGGVKQQDLHYLISPGGSKNEPTDEVIGIFGVGGKRAGVALAEHFDIKTRYRKGQTFEINIRPEWLASEEWSLQAYLIPDISPSTTLLEMSHLRKPVSDADVEELRTHLSETYARFIHDGCHIVLNQVPLISSKFDSWAYPDGFRPEHTLFDLPVDLGVAKGSLRVDMTAGLIRDRDPVGDNYGVYFYCNDRLIAKAIKTRDVGYYVGGEAGVPHPDASLCRAIVELHGQAQLMPWNSSKSSVNFGHTVFVSIRPVLIALTSQFSSLSRRLKHDWSIKVFPHTSGVIEELDAEDALRGGRLILPPLPRVNKAKAEKLKSQNKRILKQAPWTLGLLEAIAAVEIIGRQKLETRNRISLLLLDSTFEIALKEFIVHRDDLFPKRNFPDGRIRDLFRSRDQVIETVKSAIPIDPTLIRLAEHYYGMRNKLVHERATVEVTTTDVNNYRSAVQTILRLLFDLRFPSEA